MALAGRSVRVESLEGRLLLCADCVAHAADQVDLAAADSVGPAATGDELLPDMFPLASSSKGYVYGWSYDVAEKPGHVLLRLTTAMANRGAGPMELRGGTINADGTQDVYQRITLQGGGSTSRLAGKFIYHPEHEHIHFDDFAAYNLRQVVGVDGVGDVVAAGSKVSFCLLDVERFDPSLPGSPSSPRFLSCGQIQGVSVGWTDVYDQSLPDQWIDITNVPDGRYWLEVVADPSDHLKESNESNNVVRLLVTIDKPSHAPMVTGSKPTGQYPAPASWVDFRFDQPMDRASFSVADDLASFTGPGGGDLRGQLTGSAWLDDVTLRVSFRTQTALGAYSMTIGPQVLAADSAAPMDQDRDKIAGEAVQDRYTATFNVDTRVGPDAFGYDARPVPMEAIDLEAGQAGVFTIIDNADEAAVPLDLGANTFNFYGTNYGGATSLFVNSNGLINFTGGTTSFGNGDLTGDPSRPTIAALWDNWREDLGAADAVLGKFEDVNGDGALDRLVVEWSKVRRYSDGDLTSPAGAVTFQAVLTLNTGASLGAIFLNYVDLDTSNPAYADGASATVGIKAGGVQGERRLLVSYNQGDHPLVATGKAIRIGMPPSAVAGRLLFYNHSRFDGDDAIADGRDDAAVAPDKVAYLPGAARATSASLTGYSRGLNGIMVDVAGLPDRPLVAGDFEFRAGNDASPADWAPATAPAAVRVRRGAGAGGADRITLVWPDGALRNIWLRVTVKATADTGLASPDVFYFGNLVGETGDGNSQTTALVNSIDLAGTRAAQLSPALSLGNRFDHNRDGRVNALDLALVRANQLRTLPWLTSGTAPAAVFTGVMPPGAVAVLSGPGLRREPILAF